MKRLFSLFLVCLFFANCGYHLRGTGSFLPPHIKRMNIPMFKNLTTRFELDLKLTQSVIDEIVARGKVEITGNHLALDMHAFNADGSYIGVLDSFAFGDTPGVNDPPSFDGVALAKPPASSGIDYSEISSQAMPPIRTPVTC